jgi:hypothetical protein
MLGVGALLVVTNIRKDCLGGFRRQTDKINSWMPQLREAIQNLPAGSVREAEIDALQNGRVQGQILRWPN